MDFRILYIVIAALAVCHAKECENKYDYINCRYNFHCVHTFDVSREWSTFQHNYYDRPRFQNKPVSEECSKHISYSGYQTDPIYLVLKNPSSDYSNEIPVINNPYGESNSILHLIYYLDISDSNLDNMPDLKKMQNLVVLNVSRNQLETAVLSNKNEFDNLNEIDFSYNSISDIDVNSYAHPYSNLNTINISHNYLVTIPDAVFDKIDDLQTLDLSHNYIEQLSPSTFEGTRSLLHLNLSNNRLTDINSSLFRFSKLKSLMLSANRIKELKVNDFEKLNNLEYLDLSSNSIKTLDNVFQNMILLSSFDISNNMLETISEDTFANLNSLTSVYLSRNKLKRLVKDLFKNKTILKFSIDDNLLEGSLTRGMFEGIKVTSLDLSFQLLTAIEDNAFYNLTKLDSLSLNNNEINKLSKLCFRTLTGLLILDLSNNKIDNLNFDKTDLTRLQTLFLRNNRLVQIKHEHFQDLSDLLYLDLAGNAITQLEPNSFKSLKSLVDLLISNNPLYGTLKTGTFDGLASLPTLDISNSLLTVVQNASFINMIDLKYLNMSFSKIKELQFNVFLNTGFIETLDLSYNELDNFSINMTELVGLSTLLLNNNFIKTIPSITLHELSRLTKITLANNLLENIQNDTFITLTDLRTLDLSYNEKLQFTQRLLNNTKNLHTLRLDGIKTKINFTYIDESISEVTISHADLHNISALNLSALTHMTSLVLKNNSVSRLDIGAFLGLSKLVRLDLSFNKISFIQPGVFKDNELLTSLNISHNCLSAISYGTFRGLIYLTTLDLSYNDIRDLQSERLYEVKSLSHLIVDHNKIDSINAEEFFGLSKLSIGDNPLSCRILVKLKKQGVPFEITAIKIDEHNAENIDGVTCNKDQGRPIFEPTTAFSNVSDKNEILVDIRNILQNISVKNIVKDRNDIYLEKILNVIEKSNADNNENVLKLSNLTSKVIDLNNATNVLLNKILISLQYDNAVTTTTSAPKPRVNTSIDIIPYINRLKQEFEKAIADEKQNVLSEVENKLSLVHYQTETVGSSPSNEKLVLNNEGTKSIFTETCVALILLILVGMVLYKFYKSRMFIRRRMSYSTRELPGAMDNSTL